jgi:hypothetical protein
MRPDFIIRPPLGQAVCAGLMLIACQGMAGQARAEAQTSIGAGDARAAAIADASPRVTAARRDLHSAIGRLSDPRLRAVTADALENPATCILHRKNLSAAGETAIIAALADAGLIGDAGAPSATADRMERLRAGVFPPVVGAGGQCPRLPQPFYAAPGGDAAGHHSWPGGLALHTALNVRIGLDLAKAYQRQTGLSLDRDRIAAAALWHDWAKTVVFQWKADGTEFVELSLGGQGARDDDGRPGDSRTGAHHILSLAEAMSRNLAPAQIIVQACAHAPPTDGKAFKVVNWLRAAAIIARVDPVARGYLARDASGRLRLPPLGAKDAVLTAGDGAWSAECLIHNMSDQNWTFAEPSVQAADAVLAQLAPRFGYDPQAVARYRQAYRNVALSQLGADRIQILNQRGGPERVADALHALRRLGLL